jgi:dimethylglycine dehydrogenase
MLDERGGIECDLTVTRLSQDRFFVVSAAATEAHDLDWIERHVPPDGDVTVENMTARTGVLTVAGPRSRDLLQRLTDDGLSNEAFPYMDARQLRLASVPDVLALRISYEGELGWELHHPIEYLRHLYDHLLEAGEPLGLVDFGYRSLDSLRMEKGYRLWGVDISPDFTPLEVGLARFVRLDKGDFIGRDALLRQREEGIARTLACLTVETEDALPHGDEPILAADRVVGYVSAAERGHVVDATIALAYLPPELAVVGTPLEVEVLGERRTAVVVEAPLFDPGNVRLRS